MDLNQLYFDHQLLLIRSGRAVTHCARQASERGASRIAERIGHLQRSLGASAASSWEALSADGLRAQLATGPQQRGHAL